MARRRVVPERLHPTMNGKGATDPFPTEALLLVSITSTLLPSRIKTGPFAADAARQSAHRSRWLGYEPLPLSTRGAAPLIVGSRAPRACRRRQAQRRPGPSSTSGSASPGAPWSVDDPTFLCAPRLVGNQGLGDVRGIATSSA